MKFVSHDAIPRHRVAATLAIFVAIVATASIHAPTPASADSVPTIIVNSQVMTFDQPPIERSGRVYVPLRGIFEHLGASVVWTPPTTITAQRGSTSVRLEIGSSTAYVNGQPQVLDAPPFVVIGRTLVPLRFISQSLGASVNWVATNNTVYINLGTTAVQPSASVVVTLPGYLGQNLQVGQTLTVVADGPAGGHAVFAVTNSGQIPMTEASAGHYVGRLTVASWMHAVNARVGARITIGSANFPAYSTQLVTINS